MAVGDHDPLSRRRISSGEPDLAGLLLDGLAARVRQGLRADLRQDLLELIADMSGPLCLSIPATAEALGLSRTSVEELISAGRLPVVRGLGVNRTLIYRPALIQLLRDHVTGPRDDWFAALERLRAAGD